MKTYVITVSRLFPINHERKGEQTYFMEKIVNQFKPGIAFIDQYGSHISEHKIHTIRINYKLWENRIKEIQNGNAILSIRYWSGKPYGSKQVEICQLDKNSGIGVQELNFKNNELIYPCVKTTPQEKVIDIFALSSNDGLNWTDFKNWFKKYDLSKPLAIIHFTSFRYTW